MITKAKPRSSWGQAPISLMSKPKSTIIAATLLTLPAAILYRFPPDRYSFYPLCPIHQYTGLLCPGCGATRALAALLHGHLAEALHQNTLLILLLPFLLAYIALAVRDKSWPRLHPRLIAAVLLLATIFTLARNLA
jgi:hypothetical protein